MAGFALQFPASQIRSLAARYEYPDGTDLLALGKAARERGHYARGELIEVCAWKTPRSRSLAAQLAARGDLPNRSSTEGYEESDASRRCSTCAASASRPPRRF